MDKKDSKRFSSIRAERVKKAYDRIDRLLSEYDRTKDGACFVNALFESDKFSVKITV